MREAPKYKENQEVWFFVPHENGIFQGRILGDDAYYERGSGWEYEVKPTTPDPEFNKYIATVYEPWMGLTRQEVIEKAIVYWENSAKHARESLLQCQYNLLYFKAEACKESDK